MVFLVASFLHIGFLPQAGGVVGDGYANTKSSPHTNNEVFEGLGVLRAAEVCCRLWFQLIRMLQLFPCIAFF
jgi:hypothetical protein